MTSDSSHEPSKIPPTDNKHNVEKKRLKNLTSLHFQCDTFFQHTLNFTFHLFNKKTLQHISKTQNNNSLHVKI